jgi:soluble lytic murein transglycosylase-like protein
VRRRLLLVVIVAACAAMLALALLGAASAGKGRAAMRPKPHRHVAAACPLPSRYRPAFELAARQTALPLPLLVAVARVESRVEQGARSDAGAEGILQLLPSTAAALGLDPSRARTNVLAGARYLRQLLDRFESPDLALAAYNAGPGAVSRSAGAPTGETMTYVANVTALWRSLRGCR